MRGSLQFLILKYFCTHYYCRNWATDAKTMSKTNFPAIRTNKPPARA
jgi:hypothetical protein